MQKHEIPELSSNESVTLSGVAPAKQYGLAIAGGVCLIIALILGWANDDGLKHFLHTYLVSYSFYLSISLGALFFVALHHASRAGWSVCVRRVMEVVAANLFLLAILFLPILGAAMFGGSSLYEWTDPAVVEGDEILEGKSAYLNITRFAISAVAFFGIWGALIWFFWRRSLQQDESGDVSLSLLMERVSYPTLIVFALTVSFASFDWLMSLTPHWFSTAYGVYFFSGAVVASLSAVILLLIGLQATGRLTSTITTEHYHELGKLLFSFIVFWGYIAFSQYMLIWYANIPEETEWYLPRQEGGWIAISLILLFGHLFIPFFGLISRQAKRNKKILGFWAVWMLVVHWLDIFYLVVPDATEPGVRFGLIDVFCLVGLGLVFFAGILLCAGNRSLIPTKDPRLGESLGFENL
jgi:hypothetical protein